VAGVLAVEQPERDRPLLGDEFTKQRRARAHQARGAVDADAGRRLRVRLTRCVAIPVDGAECAVEADLGQHRAFGRGV
jgi:hypothetical protein